MRTEGFEGRIRLIGEEPYLPYQRPPLSKDFLAGKVDLDRVYLRPASFYEEANVELLLDGRVLEPEDLQQLVDACGTLLGADPIGPVRPPGIDLSDRGRVRPQLVLGRLRCE